jgi:hypothetical protein
MRALRVVFGAILVAAMLVSGATSVSANDTATDETIPPGPSLAEARQAIPRLNLRPVIDGTVWMEDQGVFWILDVR